MFSLLKYDPEFVLLLIVLNKNTYEYLMATLSKDTIIDCHFYNI